LRDVIIGSAYGIDSRVKIPFVGGKMAMAVSLANVVKGYGELIAVTPVTPVRRLRNWES
jgi:hypothetical protein